MPDVPTIYRTPYQAPQNLHMYGYGPEALFFNPFSLSQMLEGWEPQPNTFSGQPANSGGDSEDTSGTAAAAALAAGPAIGLANQASHLLTGQGIGKNVVDAGKAILGVGGTGAVGAGGMYGATAPTGAAADAIVAGAGNEAGNAIAGGAAAAGGAALTPAMEAGINAGLLPDLGGGAAGAAGGFEGAAGVLDAADDVGALFFGEAGAGEQVLGGIEELYTALGGGGGDQAAQQGVGTVLDGVGQTLFGEGGWSNVFGEGGMLGNDALSTIATVAPYVSFAMFAAFVAQGLLTGSIPNPTEQATMQFNPATGEQTWSSTAYEGGSQDQARKMMEQFQGAYQTAAPDLSFYQDPALWNGAEQTPLQIDLRRDLRGDKYYAEVLGGPTVIDHGMGADRVQGFQGRQFMGGITPTGLEEFNDRQAFDTPEEAIQAAIRWSMTPDPTNYDYMLQAQQRQDAR